MPHYGLLRDYRFDDLGTDEDIRGSNVYGRDDEKLGKIDDVIFDHSTGAIRYVVVDTGGWFKHKKQIETLPPYNESDVESEDKWKAYEKRYDEAWHAGPVQHRKGSDRDITPTPQEMPAESGSIGSQLTPSERAEVNSRIIPAGSDEVTIS